jgi:type IV secretory pathway VirB10-like protein
MADERDETEGEDKPRIHIVDRRMLSEDERSGKGGTILGGAAAAESGPPRLEIIGGGNRAQQPEPNEMPDAPSQDDEPSDEPTLDPQQPMPMGDPDDDDMPPMTAEEMEQARQEMEAMEAEQFAAIEQRMGRPLTEQEKESVRGEMARQAEAVTRLEIEPVLQQLMAELSARAAVHMGLMPNPYTRLIAKNDSQARLAIDAFGAMFEVIKPHLDQASQREYARVLNDLRVNFVSITGGPAGGPSRIIH